MKLNDSRKILIAGLVLALSLGGATQVRAAVLPSKKPAVVLAKAQSVANPTLSQNTQPSPIMTVPPTTLTPTPDPQSMATDPSTVTTVPMQLGTQPALAPTSRPPLGLYYGEQEHLNAMSDPTRQPLSPSPMTGSVPQSQQVAPNSGAVTVQPYRPSPVASGAGAGYALPDRFGYAPPPGTLGQTYLRRSRPIEDTKHPRVAAVEVNLPENVDVTARGLKPKWTGTLWRLESESLIPGTPHIYEIKASWNDGTPPQYRTVRLIMGRIVDLDF